jgi:MFS family permease
MNGAPSVAASPDGRAAWLVILAGVSAALHVGKLAPALTALRDALGMGLVEAGFLISLVQFAGMAAGLFIGLAADGMGLRRCMLLGLGILGLASLAEAFSRGAEALLWLRALEGLGVLLACLPAPGLIRRLVAPARMSKMLGWWGAYMPTGTALALLLGPWVIGRHGWPFWWIVLGLFSLGVMAAVARWVPDLQGPTHSPRLNDLAARLRRTLVHAGPWLVALTFAVYSAQWMLVIGFLPTVYAHAGVGAELAGLLSAMVAAVNMGGNVASGRYLARGVPARRLLWIGFCAMAVGSVVAFAPMFDGAGLWVRFAAVCVFSGVGGLIPGTLFSLCVRVAPGEDTVSTTVGWMQQWSSLGQFAGPPVAAWLASRVGDWSMTWCITLACAAVGAMLAASLIRRPAS